ncbi:hypothetical protein QT971_01170, partial [Microcoleus sp. herbarium19]|uniref:hypothetical protein n=1 Tax=unclassified Microcoleus TaxID=2642155 RepID=UPI002FCFD165
HGGTTPTDKNHTCIQQRLKLYALSTVKILRCPSQRLPAHPIFTRSKIAYLCILVNELRNLVRLLVLLC